MTRSRLQAAHALVITAVAAALVACGGAAPPAASPAAAENQPSSTAPAAAPATSPQATALPAEAPSNAGASASASLGIAQFEQSWTSLDASLSDCRRACKALASMDRACGDLCKMGDGACVDDTSRLRTARDRVRAACVSCPDGTRVDRDAPIPSTP